METMIEPTIDHAKKVIETVKCGLTSGLGSPEPGKMCVEAAVCYAFGLPHSDKPPCVGSAVRRAKIDLNDSLWSSDQARAKGMIRIAVAQLGSIEIDQGEFVRILRELIIKRIVPKYLRKIASGWSYLSLSGFRLRKIANQCEKKGTVETVEQIAKLEKVRSYSLISHLNSGNPIYAASYIATSFDKNERDEINIMTANIIEEALVICESPGCKWLFLLDEKES